MPPALPANEANRLLELLRFDILDTEKDPDFDNLAYIASEICGTPISLVSLVDADRQWFKSSIGLREDVTETDREDAFCAYNILEPESAMVIPDARLDPRFANNPLVTGYPNIVFYAGAPLVTSQGYSLGSLCVIDREKRELTAGQLEALNRLGRQVVKLMELRLSLLESQEKERALQVAHDNLRSFSHVIAHDLKAPLRNITAYAEIINEDYASVLPAEGTAMIATVGELAIEAQHMVGGVLKYSLAINEFTTEKVVLDLEEIVQHLGRRLRIPEECDLQFVGPVKLIRAIHLPLEHILQNLLGNAIQFSATECPSVTVSCEELETSYRITVRDNGEGIALIDQQKVFSMFYTTTGADGNTGHGVGLSIVSRLTELMGGTVSLVSEKGSGAAFIVEMPK